MTARLLRTIVTLVVSAVLIVLTLATAGSAAAAIPDRAFEVMGCNVGDYSCYFGRFGGVGSSYTSLCKNGNYTCTNGVPDTPAQFSQNVSPYCGDGGGAGCIGGSPLYTSTKPTEVSGSGLASGSTANGNILVTSGFVNVGTSLPQHADS